MAVVKGPLFSLDASGTIGGAIVASKWKGRNYMRRHAVPSNPQSVGQLSVRAMMQFLSQYWASLTANQQADWEDRAAVTNISPFNAFVAYNMSRWGNFLPPSIADPATAGDTAGTIANGSATAGSRCITLSIEVTVLAQNWGILVFRNLTGVFTRSREKLVHVIPAVTAAVYTWLDTPLAPGIAQYYEFSAISLLGVMGAASAEVNATPTA